MLLLRCRVCKDIFPLKILTVKHCECKESSGRLIFEDPIFVEIKGQADIIGIANEHFGGGIRNEEGNVIKSYHFETILFAEKIARRVNSWDHVKPL